MTISELAEAIVELSRSKSKIVYLPLPQDDPRQRQPDIGLAKKRLKWQPTVGLRDGLEKTIAYFDDILARTPAAIPKLITASESPHRKGRARQPYRAPPAARTRPKSATRLRHTS
jgi:UDP-glucuronate decarboxylase